MHSYISVAEITVVGVHHRQVVDRQGGDVHIHEQSALQHIGLAETRQAGEIAWAGLQLQV
jgi:hypothetical protein